MARHALQPLLAPRSVALVGASERPGSLGAIVHRNLVEGGFRGAIHPVNPKHATLRGVQAWPRLSALPEPPDLAIVATPAASLPSVIADAGAAKVPAAVVLSAGFAEAGPAGRALQEEMLAAARQGGVRILGPNCLGLMRADAGLNASFARTGAQRGRLALVSQSGAIIGAILDWAASARVGFSSVVSLGAAADVDFGEILDFLVADAETDAILLYIEGIRDARRALSALRAAARAKPVIALKVGRYATGSKAATSHTGALVGRDEVFDAALRRSGAVRVKTYTHLFAAARALASARFPHGERLAIVTNGGGPGVVAADNASENGVPLAELAPSTIALLDGKLPAQWSRGNPVDIIGDAPPQRFGDAARAVLADPGVDALLAMYSPVAVTAPEDAARALVEATKGAAKPVLAAWLGDIGPSASRTLLEANGIPNFFTPENAVEAFSFLCAYRRNQELLVQVPAAAPAAGPARPQADLARAHALRDAALAEKRTLLTEHEAKALLQAFGLAVPPTIVAASREAAAAAARQIGFPVVIKIHSPDITHKSDVGGVRLGLQNEEMVLSAFDDMLRHVRALRPAARIEGVVVQPMLRFSHQREVLVGLSTDPVFGPVVSFGSGGVAVEALRDTAVALPPLNATLARALVERTRISRVLAGYRDVPPVDFDALLEMLCGISRMACLLPWLKEMDLNPVLAHPGGAVIADARVVIDPDRTAPVPRYRHMAIHPYPEEMEAELALADGTRAPVRPVRPEDAPLITAFVDGLSEQSRYQRFMQHLPKLPPRMLARFTQLDYDRELALAVLDPADARRFIAVGRYAPNADGRTAEFALVVADAWQGRGIGRILLEKLCEAARDAGHEALYGHILEANRDMLDLARRLGFAQEGHDGTEVTVVRKLR